MRMVGTSIVRMVNPHLLCPWFISHWLVCPHAYFVPLVDCKRVRRLWTAVQFFYARLVDAEGFMGKGRGRRV